jgi:hypothetical protein
MIEQAGRARSMKVACAAPRLRASMPTAPEPAQMSRNRLPLTQGARMLKSVSRNRSEVGLTFSPPAVRNLLPLCFPPITLTLSPLSIIKNRLARLNSGTK